MWAFGAYCVEWPRSFVPSPRTSEVPGLMLLRCAPLRVHVSVCGSACRKAFPVGVAQAVLEEVAAVEAHCLAERRQWRILRAH